MPAVRLTIDEEIMEEINLISNVLHIEPKHMYTFAIVHFLSSVRSNQLQLILSDKYKNAIKDATAWQIMKQFEENLRSLEAKKIAENIIETDQRIKDVLSPLEKNE